ncbi:SpaN/EivJ family type III secretion system needle length determinant [Providencia sp. PROV197]|uniref:SpaN/EivJ family type III secretion system needle length determinant n=1 Tax=Providencia sp. PROV197 TaxID=2949898 RepID=UPI002349B073|nr:hypothetical protein [Providencia sp. PROV197]
MSVIKPFHNEKTIGSAAELPVRSDQSGQRYRQPTAANRNIPSHQKLAMKAASVFEQNTGAKSEDKGRLVGGNNDSKLSSFTGQGVPILQEGPLAISCGMHLFNGVVEPEIQTETLLELGDETELCNQQETSRDYELLDDEIPLLNMSGIPLAPNNNIVQKPNQLLMSLAKEKGNSSELPDIHYVDEQIIVNPLLLKRESKGDFFAKKPSMVLENEGHQVGGNPATERLAMGMQESKQGIEHSKTVAQEAHVNMQPEITVKDPQSDTTAKLSSAIMQERVIQDLTKSEKNQSVLQENENIDVINISRNSLGPTELGTTVQPQAQTSVARESSSVASQIDKWAGHSAAIADSHIKETLPRTLTYTFHQWKNTPSVTFELATKTDFIATTQSREVQHSLQENKYLLSGEKNIYFRQDQERGQQHRQQQEQHQQEDD